MILLDDAIIALATTASTSISRLNLARCTRVSDAGLMTVALVGRFEELSFGYSMLENIDIIVSKAAERTQNVLKDFNLASCRYLSNASLHAIAAHNNNIIFLDLSGCQDITDEGVEVLAQSCSKLEKLSLVDCNVTFKSVGKALMLCPLLESLNVAFTKVRFSKQILQKLLNEHYSVYSDDAESLEAHTRQDTALNTLQFQAMQQLDLSNLLTLQNRDIQKIPQLFPNLSVLKLCACSQLSAGPIISMTQKLFKLEYVDVSGCPLHLYTPNPKENHEKKSRVKRKSHKRQDLSHLSLDLSKNVSHSTNSSVSLTRGVSDDAIDSCTNKQIENRIVRSQSEGGDYGLLQNQKKEESSESDEDSFKLAKCEDVKYVRAKESSANAIDHVFAFMTAMQLNNPDLEVILG